MITNKSFKFDIQLFADVNYNTNVSTDTDNHGANIKDFYDTALLQNARANMVWDQFAKRQTITHGKRAEWRRFNTFAPATQPLTEAVPPDGKTFGMTAVSGDINQYGDFTAVSDVLELTGYDDTIYGATEEMGSAMGETYDVLTREFVSNGNSVLYAPNIGTNGAEVTVSERKSFDGTSRLTPKMVHNAAT